MSIDYKAAYRQLNQAYKSLLAERMQTASPPGLLEWIADSARGPAITSFSEGPERQIAYAIENALRLAEETCEIPRPFTMRPTERCPQCGYTQVLPVLTAEVKEQ